MMALYAKGHDYFHSDNSLGIDFYNIGPTLGCGGLGVWFDGKLYRSENYYVSKGNPKEKSIRITSGSLYIDGKLSHSPEKYPIQKIHSVSNGSIVFI
jgi:pectinesterase